MPNKTRTSGKAEEQTITEETQEEGTPTAEPGGKGSCYIYTPTKAYERILKWAEYATIEGLIEGHPRGDFSSYCNFCFNVGEQYLRQYMLKKRGYK